MRLSKTAWIVLGIAVFVIGAIVIFMLYQGQVDKRQEARDELESAQETSLYLLQQNASAEAELTEKENEVEQWKETIEELSEQITQTNITLNQTKGKFPVSVESIEYDEKLFEIAFENEIEIVTLNASELSEAIADGINYQTTTFGIDVRGEVSDILTFINTIISEEEFKTANIEQANITIPEPLNNKEIEELEQELRNQLTSEALTEISAEKIMTYTLEAINEVIGEGFIDQITFGNDGILEALSITEMAETIKERITDSIYLEQEYEGLVADNLAEIIRDFIAGSAVNTTVSLMAEQIADIINPGEIVEGEEGEGENGEAPVEIIYDQDALIELLGEDMAALLGVEIAGATAGDITKIINEIIAGLIESKMLISVVDSVEEAVNTTIPTIVEGLEMPSTSIIITVYLYQDEGR
jgi:hypothetical protein